MNNKITRWVRMASISALILLAFNGSLMATTHSVVVTNNRYTPSNLNIFTGDTVVWNCTQGSHNVNGMKSTFPNNPVSFGNDVGSNWTYKFVFTMPGVYDYHCDPHAGLGMIGKVTVTSDPGPFNLTIAFSGMNPHVGQYFALYLKDIALGLPVDSVILQEIPGAAFSVISYSIVPGRHYSLDFFADHNGNKRYDAPPADHAWRLDPSNFEGDTTVTFTHNTNFTDIFGTSGVASSVLNTRMLLYPNPVAEIAILDYQLSASTVVQIEIYMIPIRKSALYIHFSLSY